MINIIKDLKQAYNKRNASGFLIDFCEDTTNAVFAIYLCFKTGLPRYAITHDVTDVKRDFLSRHSVWIIRCEHRLEKMVESINNLNLLSVGLQDKYDLKWIRNYQHFSVVADIFPFKELNKSNLDELYKSNIDLNKTFEKMVWEKRPNKTDYIGSLGITYEELEWADNMNDNTHILEGGIDPTKNGSWFSYTGRQKRVLSKIFQIEQSTRYKLIK